MTQHIKLDGRSVLVWYGFNYSGSETHPAVHQEVPAAFFNPTLTTLVIPEGKKLRRSTPGWPNEHHAMPEHWAAWVDDKNYGAGLFSPLSNELTCYRFGKKPTDKSACSYFAPIITKAITPKSEFKYSIALAIGTPEEIQAEFERIRPQLQTPLAPASSKQ
jgi:hypothetical protein